MSIQTASQKPSFILVPGSFSPKESYAKVVDLLAKQGYESVPTDLLTAAGGGDPAPSMADDAAAIHDATLALADQGIDVVLVAHSYGGIPVTESARGLLKADRAAEGKKGGVIALVYLTALVVGEGQSLATASDGGPSGWIIPNGEWMHITDLDAAASGIYSSLPFEEAKTHAATLRDHSAKSFGGELTYPAYKHLPVFYVVCTKDKIIQPERQRSMIEQRREEGAKIDVTELETDHAPLLSMPERVVEVLVKAAAA